MKIFFIKKEMSQLADPRSSVLENTRKALLNHDFVEEVTDPSQADALIIHEKISFKNFRYIKTLMADPIISKYTPRIYTINYDDCASGLLKGLYSNIPLSRIDYNLHVPVPYADYFNELVFTTGNDPVDEPKYLATWRGNLRSNKIRPIMVKTLKDMPDCLITFSDSWFNHPVEEKSDYIQVIQNGKFSLCPAGWASSSYRIYESMALGRCPVIIADDFAPPKGPNWDDFALFYPESKMKEIHSFLKENEYRAVEMGLKAREAWDDYFQSNILPQYYADALIRLIRNFDGHSRETEIKRWKSLKFYWSNKWTIPQRISIKLKQLNLL